MDIALIIITGLVVFIVLLIVLNKIFGDDKAKYKKRSLEGINRDFDFDSETSSAFVEENIDKFGETVSHFPIIGRIYRDLLYSGSTLNLTSYLILLVGIFVVAAYLTHMLGSSVLLALLLGFGAMFFFNNIYLGNKLEKRNRQFLNDFPDALDMIVRSIKSGHPLLTSLKLIADNSRPPLSTEFQRVIDEVSYGRPMPEALRKMADRIGILDVNFFVVILSVQQETGGSMAEVLNNLSVIIRKRKQLNLKIRALTSEGRITVWIFAAIPLVMIAAVRLTAAGRDYQDPLFNTDPGQTCLAVAGALILLAIYIARQLCKMDM